MINEQQKQLIKSILNKRLNNFNLFIEEYVYVISEYIKEKTNKIVYINTFLKKESEEICLFYLFEIAFNYFKTKHNIRTIRNKEGILLHII